MAVNTEASPPPKLVIQDAYSYLNHKPSRALAMIDQGLHQIEQADVATRSRGYLIGLWAGIYLNDPAVQKRYSDKLLELSASGLLKRGIHHFLLANAGHLWRMNNSKEAFILALCALDHVPSPERFLSNLSMLNVTSSKLYPDASYQLNLYALELANVSKITRFKASFNNNLGVNRLNNGDYHAARDYFSSALDLRYEQGSITGQINAGSNLMLVYLLLNERDRFDRISLRIARLLEQTQSDFHQAYYQWIMAANRFARSGAGTTEMVQELQNWFEAIGNQELKHTLHTLGRQIGFTLELESLPPSQFPIQASHTVMSLYPMCEEENLQQTKFVEIKQKLNNVEQRLKLALNRDDTP